MGTAPAFASVSEAIDMARAALCYLAAADAAQLPAETQADCLRGLDSTDAVATAARASFLSAFTTGQGYSADADYSARAWLMHKTGITRGAAASHTAWANRYASASGGDRRAGRRGAVRILRRGPFASGPTSCPRSSATSPMSCWSQAAAAGLGLADLSALFAEMYQRARSDLPDEDPGRDFADRGVRLGQPSRARAFFNGDLTPECAAVVGKVLDALSAPAGAEDDRTQEQRYHEPGRTRCAACRRRPAAGAGRQPVKVWAHIRWLTCSGWTELRAPGQWIARSGRSAATGRRVEHRVPGLDEPLGRSPATRHGADRDRRRQLDASSTSPAVVLDQLPGARGLPVRRPGRARAAVIGQAVDLLSGPGGLAYFLRRRQLGARLAGPSLPLDIGYAETDPGGHPQRGNAPGPALPVGRRVQPASLSL